MLRHFCVSMALNENGSTSSHKYVSLLTLMYLSVCNEVVDNNLCQRERTACVGPAEVWR